MDQVTEQSTVDTAAQQPQATPAAEKPSELKTEPETQGAESTTSKEDNALDYSKLGQMSAEEQFAALSKAGVFGEGDKPADKPQEPAQQPEKPEHKNDADQGADQSTEGNEPEFEITIDGKKVKVKQSELLSGYQRQADYTRKTQELAEQRRQIDAMMAALKVQQQTNPQPAGSEKPANKVQAEYQDAVAQAEHDLGIAPGAFNPFDPQHMFALQRVTSQVNAQQAMQQAKKAQVQTEINNFVVEAKQDPLTPKIDASFNQYAFKLATESPEGAQKCMAIMQARDRFLANQATSADTKILREHWNYVKGELTKAAAPPVTQPAAPAASKPEPPKTETPGKSAASHHAALDCSKLGQMNSQQQLAALRKAGYL